MKKILAIILAGLMVFSLCACGNGETPATETPEDSVSKTSEETVNDYYKAIANADGETIFKTMVHPFMLEQKLLEEEFEDEADAIEKFNEEAKNTLNAIEDSFGDNIKIDVVHKTKTEYIGEELDKINKYLYDECECPQNYVSELQVLGVEITIKGDDREETQGGELVLANIEGSWYVVAFSGIYDNNSIKDIIAKY